MLLQRISMFIAECLSVFSFGGTGLVQNHPLRVRQKIQIEKTHIEFLKVIADTRSPSGTGCNWPGVFVAEFLIVRGFEKKKVLLGFRGGEPVRIDGAYSEFQMDYKTGTTTVGDMEYQIIFINPKDSPRKKLSEKSYVVSLLVKR